MFSTLDLTSNHFKSVETKTIVYQNSARTENYSKNLIFVGLTPRSRFGCLVCRKKKKRCDEIKPVCGLCNKTGSPCKWKPAGTERKNKKRKTSTSEEAVVHTDEEKDQDHRESSEDQRDTPEMNLQPLSVSPPADSTSSEDFVRVPQSNQNIVLDNYLNEKSAPHSIFGEYSFDNYFENITNKCQTKPSKSADFQIPTNSKNNNEEVVGNINSFPDSQMSTETGSFAIFNNFTSNMPSLPTSRRLDDTAVTNIQTSISNELMLLPLDESQQIENLQDRYGMLDEKKLIQYNNSIISNPDSFTSKISKNEYGKLFFEFYKYSIVHHISVVPEKLNFYINFFLPMAHNNEVVLSCLTTWGGLALYGKDDHIVREHIAQSLDLVQKQEAISTSHQEHIVLLTCYIILMSAYIYSGDVSMDWFQFFIKCHTIMKDKVGIKNFKDINEKWLVINFIYHDLLTSHHHEYGTFLTCEELNEFYPMHESNNSGKSIGLIDSPTRPAGKNLNIVEIEPLQGLLMPIYSIIGEIINQSVTLRNQYMDLDLNIEDIAENLKYFKNFDDIFESLNEKTQKVQPNKSSMIVLSQESLEIQLRLFELFRLVVQLYLRQILKKYPPSLLEMQCLTLQSLQLLKDLITSEVKSALCFPLLIIGINCCDFKTRTLMESYFENLQDIYHVKNIEKCRIVINEVWKMNLKGDTWVDWFKVTKDLDWFLNLA